MIDAMLGVCSAGEQVIPIEQPQMQTILVVAVEFRIRAVLLDDEDVDAQLQHVVEFDGGELLKLPHVDGIGNRHGQ